MSDDERREADVTAIRAIIEHARVIQEIVANLRERGITSEELQRVEERAVEADLWAKRHGNRHALGY